MPLQCSGCARTALKRVVCIDCHEELVIRLGKEIRTLQSDLLRAQTTSNLLRVIAQAAARKSRLKTAEKDPGALVLLPDQQQSKK